MRPATPLVALLATGSLLQAQDTPNMPAPQPAEPPPTTM